MIGKKPKKTMREELKFIDERLATHGVVDLPRVYGKWFIEHSVEIRALISSVKCKICCGTGKIDDAAPGDIGFNEWPCNECNGTGEKL
jgi:hypothetical protein